jgi:hypothetical protein
MGSIRKPHPVKLIVGFIYKDRSILAKAEQILKKNFGPVDLQSKILAFTHTDYYEKELGSGLKRKFISFKSLILPQKLAGIKVFTNSIEKKFSRDSRRLINIDPGYIDLPKLVLASAKDFSHRIYIGRGIHAEVTLSYQGKAFRWYEWTFPDYRTPQYIEIFTKIREIYFKQVRK